MKTKEADDTCINEISAKYKDLEDKCTTLLSENKNAIRGIRLQSMKDKIKRLKTTSGNYILHFLREGTNQICTYDLELNQSKTHTLASSIPSGNISTLMHNGKLYITGGFNGIQYLNNSYEYSLGNTYLAAMANMIYEKEGHSMCVLNKEY